MRRERPDYDRIDRREQAEYERLIVFLNNRGLSATRLDGDRIGVSVTTTSGTQIDAEILMTPEEWSSMTGTMHGEFEGPAKITHRALTNLEGGDRYLVFLDYELQPQTDSTLPEKTRRQRRDKRIRRFPDDRLSSLTYLRSQTALPKSEATASSQPVPHDEPPTDRKGAVQWLIERHPAVDQFLRLFDADPLSAVRELVEVFDEEIETARAWREYGKNNPQPHDAEAHDVWWAGGPGYSPAQQTLGDLSDAQYGAAKMLAMLYGNVEITASTTYGVSFANSRTEFIDDWLRVLATGAGRWKS